MVLRAVAQQLGNVDLEIGKRLEGEPKAAGHGADWLFDLLRDSSS